MIKADIVFDGIRIHNLVKNLFPLRVKHSIFLEGIAAIPQYCNSNMMCLLSLSIMIKITVTMCI